MRFIITTLPVALVSLSVGFGLAAAPALARTADAAKPVAEAAPSPCHAYEQNPDGSWHELSCAENGMTQPAPARISTRNEGKVSR